MIQGNAITVKSTKILLVPSKYEIIFGALLKCLFFWYCDGNICLFSNDSFRSFISAISKAEHLCFIFCVGIVGREIAIEREMKQRNHTKKIKQRRLRAITLQGAVEKSQILENINWIAS